MSFANGLQQISRVMEDTHMSQDPPQTIDRSTASSNEHEALLFAMPSNKSVEAAPLMPLSSSLSTPCHTNDLLTTTIEEVLLQTAPAVRTSTPEPQSLLDAESELAVHSSGYILRKNRAENDFPGSNWDDDTSGTYDDTGKLARLTPEHLQSPTTARKRRRRLLGDNSSPRKKTKASYLQGRREGRSNICVLRISSSHLQKWPAGVHYSPDVPEPVFGPDWSDLNASLIQGKRLRSQLKHCTKLSNKSYEDTFNKHHECDPNEYKGFTLGHPEARGCKECVDSNEYCSMIERGGKWPCDDCKTKGLGCDPLVFRQKESCNRCRARGHRCSYLMNENNHNLPCLQCQNDREGCEAGPKMSRYRMTQDDIPLAEFAQLPFDLDPGRTPMACSPCSEDGKERQCSAIRKNAMMPCSCCKKKGRTCHFKPSSQPRSTSSNSSATSSLETSTAPTSDQTPRSNTPTRNITAPKVIASVEPSRPVSQAAAAANSLSSIRREAESTVLELVDFTGPETITTIRDKRTNKIIKHAKILRTRFAHPISFDNHSGACDFCTNADFGINGCGRILNVTVIPNIDPKSLRNAGYQELSGGYRARGKEPTRMCIPCSLARIRIVKCYSHQIEPIPGIPEALDYNAVLSVLRNKLSVREAALKNVIFCSICPLPANFQCQTAHARDSMSNWTEKSGCGLTLCAKCAELMCGGQGVRQTMKARQRELQEVRRRCHVRADVEFLINGIKTINWHG